MEILKVFITGAGLMGGGIAQACAQAGIEVLLNDVSPEALQKGIRNIAWSLKKLAGKGALSETKETILERIRPVAETAEARDVDLAIEAVYENLELKKEIFSALDRILQPRALLASNTSAIPITELAAVTRRADRVLGLHFFSPVPLMQAVEVIRGLSTSDETVQTGRKFVVRIGKEAIMVNRDVPGFAINRINFPASIEAMNLVEQGVASVADIDRGLRLASGRKMGIFETGDMVGLDVTHGALMALYHETGDARWYPPLLLRRKVKAGHLGRKTGKGWYEYHPDGSRKDETP